MSRRNLDGFTHTILIHYSSFLEDKCGGMCLKGPARCEISLATWIDDPVFIMHDTQQEGKWFWPCSCLLSWGDNIASPEYMQPCCLPSKTAHSFYLPKSHHPSLLHHHGHDNQEVDHRILVLSSKKPTRKPSRRRVWTSYCSLWHYSCFLDFEVGRDVNLIHVAAIDRDNFNQMTWRRVVLFLANVRLHHDHVSCAPTAWNRSSVGKLLFLNRVWSPLHVRKELK